MGLPRFWTRTHFTPSKYARQLRLAGEIGESSGPEQLSASASIAQRAAAREAAPLAGGSSKSDMAADLLDLKCQRRGSLLRLIQVVERTIVKLQLNNKLQLSVRGH